MIILNFGIPRSGTVWTYNVFRSLWRREQISYHAFSPNSPLEVDECLDQLNPRENYLIHGHSITPALVEFAQRPDVRPFFNYRDPRDVVVSQIRLHDISLATAMEFTQQAYRSLQTGMCLPGIMLIPYGHIVDHPEAVIFQAATKLGIMLRLSECRTIGEENSMGRLKKVMEAVNDTKGHDTESLGVDVGVAETNTRDIRYDRRHLITDRHIQSGKTGRWREELSEDDQDLVNRAFGPLIQVLGFDA